MILMEKRLLEPFMKKNSKKQITKEFRIEKIIKKGDKLYVKWKVYDNVFNRCIDKKRHSISIIN